MKVHMRKALSNDMTLSQFADTNNLEMEVVDRGEVNCGSRYYAHFINVDLSGPGVLIGTFGNGNTPEEAMLDYMSEIQGNVSDPGYPPQAGRSHCQISQGASITVAKTIQTTESQHRRAAESAQKLEAI